MTDLTHTAETALAQTDQILFCQFVPRIDLRQEYVEDRRGKAYRGSRNSKHGDVSEISYKRHIAGL